MEKNISLFIKNLNILVGEIEKLFPTNGEILSLGNKIRIFKNEIGRKELVECFGEILYRYKDYIRNNDVKFFHNINNIKQSLNINDGNKKNIISIFSTIKNKYEKLSDEKKKFLFTEFNLLLDSYEVVIGIA